MPKLTGADRNQLQMMSLEGCIDEDNPVRVIDTLIDLFDLDQLGFIKKGHSREGRPAYTVRISFNYTLLKGLQKVDSGIWIGLLQLQPQKIDVHFGGTNAGQPPQRGFGNVFKAFQPVLNHSIHPTQLA